jgi:hypothetical protein
MYTWTAQKKPSARCIFTAQQAMNTLDTVPLLPWSQAHMLFDAHDCHNRAAPTPATASLTGHAMHDAYHVVVQKQVVCPPSNRQRSAITAAMTTITQYATTSYTNEPKNNQ